MSDFASKSNTNDPQAFRQRVFAQPSLIESSALALRNGERLLKALSDYLQVNYTLPKMDQVAVPDFGFQGMRMSRIIDSI